MAPRASQRWATVARPRICFLDRRHSPITTLAPIHLARCWTSPPGRSSLRSRESGFGHGDSCNARDALHPPAAQSRSRGTRHSGSRTQHSQQGGHDGWSDCSGGRRGRLHAGGVEARPLVDHRADGVRRRRRDPRSRRAGCPAVLAGQRDGPDHHRADAGPAAVRRCLDGPAAGCRGRCGSAPPAAVRRAAADDRCRRAAGLPDVSRRSGGRRQPWSPPSWRPPTRRSAWRSSPTSPCRCGSGER